MPIRQKAFTRSFELLVIGLCFFALKVSAQNGSISGKILDEKGSPISYGTVVLEGTQQGATANEDGSYEITNVPAGTYTLKVSYVGYLDSRQQVILSGANQVVNFSLKPTFQSLNEVVVLGYQTEKRS
ncbi:MAG: carboxypeptidase-like regulatory domain-containing protein, partial [Chitinophagales bacterium]